MSRGRPSGRNRSRWLGGPGRSAWLLATFLLLADGTGAPWLLAAALGGVAYLVLVVRTGLLPADVMAWARQAVAQRRVVAETGSARAA